MIKKKEKIIGTFTVYSNLRVAKIFPLCFKNIFQKGTDFHVPSNLGKETPLYGIARVKKESLEIQKLFVQLRVELDKPSFLASM